MNSVLRVKKQKTDRKDAQLLLTLIDGRSLSANLDIESGKSRCASTAGAPASAGTNAYTDHESVAGSRDERRPALEIKTVQRTGASGIGETRVGSLGQPSAFGCEPNALPRLCICLIQKNFGSPGRIRTSNISVNSRWSPKSKCPIWCRLQEIGSHFFFACCTYSCTHARPDLCSDRSVTAFAELFSLDCLCRLSHAEFC